MPNYVLRASVVVAALCVSSCNQPPQVTTPAKVPETHYQRFVPIAPENKSVPWHAFFALDTQTGQLCRTTILVLQDEYMATVPTCYSLYVESNPAPSRQKETGASQ